VRSDRLRQQYTEQQFCLLFSTEVEIGLSHRGTQAEDVPEQGAGKYIWTYERRGKRSGLEHIKRSSTISHFAKYYSDDQTKKGWAGHVARM
jgi:uncharacterized protein YkwD